MRLIISKLDTIIISKQEAAMQGVTTFEFEDLRCGRYAMMIRQWRVIVAEQGNKKPCMPQKPEAARQDHACSCSNASVIDCLERMVMAIGKPVAMM